MIKNIKKNNKKLFISIFLSFLFIFSLFNFNVCDVYAEENTSTEIQNNINEIFVNNFDNIKNRTAGSVGEKNMANILANYLEQKNVEKFFEDSYIQEFSLSNSKSQNVVGFVNNNSSKYVVLCAHYDSIYVSGSSYGYSDNFSGVLAVLGLTNYFISNANDFNVIIAFFGAEELGSKGSQFFLENLNKTIRNNILLSINFDSIGCGDYLYYYHTDFSSKYGNILNNYFANTNIKNASGKINSPLTYRDFNYTALGLNSDNSSFISYGINSLLLFAGNIEDNLSYKETTNCDKIMHNTDSKETAEKIFGEKYVENIENSINAIKSLVSSDDFNEENFDSNQINPIVFSPWVLKFFGVGVVLVLFVVYLVWIKPKNL